MRREGIQPARPSIRGKRTLASATFPYCSPQSAKFQRNRLTPAMSAMQSGYFFNLLTCDATATHLPPRFTSTSVHAHAPEVSSLP